jgi:uncharacterized protein
VRKAPSRRDGITPPLREEQEVAKENVEAVRRATDAFNREDIDALLEDAGPEVEWHPMFQVLFGGEAAVYRGQEGYREFQRDTNEAFAEQPQIELSEVRDLGERVVAIGRLRGRGRESGVETNTAIAWLIEFRNGKAFRVREYLDPKRSPRSRRAEGVGLRRARLTAAISVVITAAARAAGVNHDRRC